MITAIVIAALLGQAGQVASDSTPIATQGSLGITGPLATTAPLNLFVDTTNGNDSNACTTSGAGACKTIDAARAKVPLLIQDPVTISIAAGTYTAGAYVSGFTCSVNTKRQPTSQTTGPSLKFVCGSYTASSLSQGLQTGTVASAVQGNTGILGAGAPSTWGTFTVTGAGWAVNNLATHLVQLSGGTCTPTEFALIDSNTATVATIAGVFPVTPDGTCSFAVVDPGCVCNNVLPRPPGALGYAFSASTSACFLVANNNCQGWVGGTASGSDPVHVQGGTVEPPIDIEGFAFTSASTTLGVGIAGPGYTAVRYSSCSGGPSVCIDLRGQTGGLWAESNFYTNAATNGSLIRVTGTDANSPSGAYLRAFGNIMNGSGRGMILRTGSSIIAQNDFTAPGPSAASLFVGGAGANILSTGNHFNSNNFGIGSTGGNIFSSTNITSDGDTFTNCTVAVNLGVNTTIVFSTDAQLGSGNSQGIVMDEFSSVNYEIASSMTSTTDLIVGGGGSYSFVQLRAPGGNLKTIRDLAIGAHIHED